MAGKDRFFMNRNNNLAGKEKRAVNELIMGLKNLYGKNLSKVILYGSKARGDSTKNSDIDILIVLKKINTIAEDRKRIYDLAWKASYYYDLLISVAVKEERSYLELSTPFIMNVKREGVSLWAR